nr:DUF2852 domain-containing protein [Paracoccus sp. S-4012]
MERVIGALTGIRDWLDERGRIAWIVAMILGFVVAWPVGLFILGYMIWSNRMFCSARRHHGMTRHRSAWAGAPTGNTVFDAYREETLKRLEEEHAEFLAFLQKLRDAKDKAEFDQFMAQRRNAAGQPEA